jgi:diguanylate cyclase (GGDEF)-like protein
LCRYGGDEFVVLFDYSSGKGAEQFMVRLREAISALKIDELPGWNFSVSSGCASFPADGADWEALMDVADRRMYRQKAAILREPRG